MNFNPLSRAAVAALSLLAILSCNHTGSIPFPEKELGYAQPLPVPLKFSAEKKLRWDTVSNGEIKPVVKKLDLDALPSAVYDSTGFRPLKGAPSEVRFDLSQLPGIPFSLDSLPSKPLPFKTRLLPPPAVTKVQLPALRKGNPLSLYDLGPAQGLPAKFVVCLFKDKHGLLWISSAEGLFRYDGEHYQTIIPGPIDAPPVGMAEDNDGNIWAISFDAMGMINLRNGTASFTKTISTPVNNLSKIIKDESGKIWISKTSAGNVLIIDPATKTYKSLDSTMGLSPGQPTDIVQDDDKNTWIISNTSGASIINAAKNKVSYLKKINGLGNDSLRAITKDKAGKIWIARTGGSLDMVDGKQGTIRNYERPLGFTEAFTSNISSDDKGRIWMGKNRGADVFDPANNTIRNIDKTRGLMNDWVASCTPDGFGRIWVATISGLSMIDDYAESAHPFNTSVVSLMEDGARNLWVATQNGLFIIDSRKKIIRSMDETHGLSNDFVQSFSRSGGNVIVATNGGYNIIDPVKKTITITGKKEGLTSDVIYSAFLDKAGNTWLVGPADGVNVVDAGKKLIRHVAAEGGLSDNNIQDIKEDANGLIWLATQKSGVNIIDPVTGTVKYLNDQPGLKDTCNRILIADKEGRMWIGTDRGIYVVDIKNNTLTPITTKEGLTDNRVLSLLEHNGNILAGTNRKITFITAPAANSTDTTNGWKIAPLVNSAGLIKENNSWASDYITASGQYLWGDNDLTVINEIKPETASAPVYVTGISIMTKPLSFINESALNSKDTVWSGDTYYVAGTKKVKTGYAIDNKFPMDSTAGPYNMPVNLQLPHDQNYIQFQFAQFHLGSQSNSLYTYTLEGIDKNWSTPNSNPYTENYLNLPPGAYTFKVSGKNLNGKWSAPAAFSFTISPPWYQTWWAYAIYTLLGIILLRGYIVYRSRRLKKENKILEEKVALRTEQLQKSLEDLKATQAQLIQSEKMASLGELTAGIAHEIQNPLNFINNFSEVNTELIGEMQEEIKKGNYDEVKAIADDIAANEQKITHHGKRADGIVKGMLQHSRSGNRQKEPTNINNLADEYLRLAYHGLRAKDKSFNATMKTDFDETTGSVNIIAQDIGRVVLNLITNAFYSVTQKKKQDLNGYEPTVTVSTKKWLNKVEVRVKDNGMGVPQKVLDKIFQPFFTTKPTGEGTGLGLSLSYDIIKAHNGELKVETKEGEGAEFIIILPQ
ncbi:MAG: two-component regulator propeller domain-containing protein [Ferruginibacter sp.]